MLWLYLIAVVLLGTAVAALLGRWEGAAVPQEESDMRESEVDDLLRRRADQPIRAADLQEVRLDSAVRGYRMDQVDRLLDALAAQLETPPHDRPQEIESAAMPSIDPPEDRFLTFAEPDLDPAHPASDGPDQDLSPPGQDHSRLGYPRVE
ncbi:DivIVA domain-containing protein [Nesterenkonia sandarakina]|uniref:DivIVA domain-containing protein n=1 Tax=Nesterenkonia sandarakina TaxID=272918 RepID=A0A2T0YIL1_9MICC|nr:DivIVA domain-containing protein [Nesterenkonia sandarakina]PRZ14976.1 DivIVA domain-containing protein [Nesterenkonia sandarakina]